MQTILLICSTILFNVSYLVLLYQSTDSTLIERNKNSSANHGNPKKSVTFVFNLKDEVSAYKHLAMTSRRIEEEKKVVEQMIRLYCRKREGHAELCPSCRELMDYALSRLDRCRFGHDKPTCKKCPVHCYRPEMKEQIKRVMRWSGPRMMFYHPLAAIRHLLREMN